MTIRINDRPERERPVSGIPAQGRTAFHYICLNLCAEKAVTVERNERAADETVHCPNCGRLMARVLGPVLERPKR